MGAQKFMGAQKLLRGRDASSSLRHPQMAPTTVRRFISLLLCPKGRFLYRTRKASGVGVRTSCCVWCGGVN